MRILVIEDELELLQSIGKGLELGGYYVDLADSGEKGLELFDTESYDVIILDLNLPKISGFDVLQTIMEKDNNAKVLILTANSSVDIKIKGLDLGASDYIVKPFHFKELEARIRVLLRRNFLINTPILTCGDLSFNTVKRELYAADELVTLTKKETAIIEYLLLNQERMVTAEDLLAHAWDADVDYFSNSVRVHLTTLRKKIKTVLGYNPIANKIGEGYYLLTHSENK
ncbi:DNA-binding response regulator, OmpR family, contains REC and winged-helix (wHTH) domain [Granulicatella balaenopterae]|uniref:DNA-binding response regulator, OmpR family, contains REC and winged-helix (WHTH) domain n=1 Tax=Granulicatella balaenopterae TaxID=137733 RepID=A0A1H9I9E6_9LACT|nr:response regulator transcription factor [Granulicatella balaenopterae]SEQ71194.1 DNA-binding response regulator, OmpR family, contains REC and winged-helix (wHTH) domain [Granulicatella balaenopterae]